MLQLLYLKLLLIFCFVVTTTTSRAVTVSTRGCTYRLPGSFRQFPLRGSNYADPADIQMLRLVLGSPAGGLSINGSDGRSLLSSRPEVACVPPVTPARAIRLLSRVPSELTRSSAIRNSRIEFDAPSNVGSTHPGRPFDGVAGATERSAIRSFFLGTGDRARKDTMCPYEHEVTGTRSDVAVTAHLV